MIEDARAGIGAAAAGGFDSAGPGEAAGHERAAYSLSRFGGLMRV